MTDRFTGIEVVELQGQAADPPLSSVSTARIYDNTATGLRASVNGGPYGPFAVGGAVEMFWAATDYNANADGLDFRARSVPGTGGHRFTFFIPFDAASIVDIVLVAVSGLAVANPTADIDLFSDYGSDGEQADNHSESDVASTYAIPAQIELFEIDISAVFSVVAAGDRCGLFVDHNTITGDIDYLGIRLRYTQ